MFDLIEESGTYTSTDLHSHPHNGYFSGFAVNRPTEEV